MQRFASNQISCFYFLSYQNWVNIQGGVLNCDQGECLEVLWQSTEQVIISQTDFSV